MVRPELSHWGPGWEELCPATSIGYFLQLTAATLRTDLADLELPESRMPLSVARARRK